MPAVATAQLSEVTEVTEDTGEHGTSEEAVTWLLGGTGCGCKVPTLRQLLEYEASEARDGTFLKLSSLPGFNTPTAYSLKVCRVILRLMRRLLCRRSEAQVFFLGSRFEEVDEEVFESCLKTLTETWRTCRPQKQPRLSGTGSCLGCGNGSPGAN